MMLFRYFSYGIFLAIFFCGTLFCEAKTSKPLRIATIPIPLLVEDSEHGVFVALTREIAKRNNLQIEISVAPVAKSLLSLSNGEADVFFPALEDYSLKNSPRSVTFYEKTDFIFHLKGRNYNSIRDLNGKRVGLTFRYHYTPEFTRDKRVEFIYADDDVTNMKKLGAGQIDAFVVEERSGLKALELSGAQNIVYDRTKPLSRLEVFYAFQDTEEGRNLSQIFSKTIESLKKEGTFNKIMLSHPSKLSE